MVQFHSALLVHFPAALDKGDARVSIEPFYTAAEINVMGRKITVIEFIPDVAGEFTIRYDPECSDSEEANA
jgi:hypothetical protein